MLPAAFCMKLQLDLFFEKFQISAVFRLSLERSFLGVSLFQHNWRNSHSKHISHVTVSHWLKNNRPPVNLSKAFTDK